MSSTDPFPGRPITAMDLWFDANLRHQIGLLRRSGAISKQVTDLLDATEEDLRLAVQRRLRAYKGTMTPANVVRMEKLLADIQEIRSTAWTDAMSVWQTELRALALAEPRFLADLLKTTIPVQLSITLPSATQVQALAEAQPFLGRTMVEWARSIAPQDVVRLQDQVRIGMMQGEDIPTISRRLVGTVSKRGRDGATAISRRYAQTITRTAANHFANSARRAFAEENREYVPMELWVSTLDARTTPICRSLDGKRFPVGEPPTLPLHWNERSVRTLIPDEEALGDRPFNPTTERGLLREFAEKKGFRAPTKRGDLPRGMKGEFDRFAQQRKRELIGQVPAKTTYQQFLSRQPASFQDDVLGPTRGKLFRQGGLKVDHFVDSKTFQPFTLNDLARMHADAFRAAGLDPADFITRAAG